MAEREYRLPNYAELNKEEHGLLQLSKDGRFLVMVGPGIRSSYIGLLRSLRYENDNNCLLLTSNYISNAMIKQLSGYKIDSQVATAWFYNLQYKLTNMPMPLIDGCKPDYNEVMNRFQTLNVASRGDHLIILEGLDMPLGFYETVMTIGYENFFIIVPQSSQIYEDYPTIIQLRDILDLEKGGFIEINENHRNTNSIVRLTDYFYSINPIQKLGLPYITSLDTPVLFEYESISSCIEMILREADSDNSKLIGIIVANDKMQINFTHKLNNTDIVRDNDKPVISSYTYKEKQNVDINFKEGGIVILLGEFAKWIEFDVVFIVIDGFKVCNNDIYQMKHKLYMMTYAAKDKLIIFKSKLYDDGVDQLLPTDNLILERSEF